MTEKPTPNCLEAIEHAALPPMIQAAEAARDSEHASATEAGFYGALAERLLEERHRRAVLGEPPPAPDEIELPYEACTEDELDVMLFKTARGVQEMERRQLYGAAEFLLQLCRGARESLQRRFERPNYH